MKIINLEYHPHDSRLKINDGDVAQTLTSRMGTGGGNVPIIIVEEENMNHKKKPRRIVRRLTPKECERLQGFPDDWTATGINEKGKEIRISDTARYKACGNSVALPCVDFIMQKIVRELNK